MSYSAGIIAAIANLKDHTGSSSIAIKKTMQASMPKDKKWMNATFLAALKKMVADGTLVQNNASYKLSPKKKEETAPQEERVPMLGEDQSASSSSIPKPVSRHGRKKAADDAREEHTKAMNDNLRLMTMSMVSITNSMILRQISRCENERFELELTLLNVNKDDNKRLELIQKRIAEINSTIQSFRQMNEYY